MSNNHVNPIFEPIINNVNGVQTVHLKSQDAGQSFETIVESNWNGSILLKVSAPEIGVEYSDDDYPSTTVYISKVHATKLARALLDLAIG